MIKICSTCGSTRLMDRRKAFFTTYGVVCLIIGCLGAVISAVGGWEIALYVSDGFAAGGGLWIAASTFLKSKGEQQCMNCGSKFDPNVPKICGECGEEEPHHQSACVRIQ